MSADVALRDETALVVGGSRNIGLAIARALEAAGARVCIVGGSDRVAVDGAAASLGEDALGLVADMTQPDAVDDVYARVEAALGPVSILVNSAGLRPRGALTELTPHAWQAVIDVMLTAPFLASQALFRHLPPERHGAIVNLGGLSGHRPVRDRAHVITAKAGLVGLTRALAEEGLGRIRANCVVPGAIDTERRPGQPQARHAGDEHRARGRCEDVARVVLCFANPAETYVTGQTVHVSGGRYMP